MLLPPSHPQKTLSLFLFSFSAIMPGIVLINLGKPRRGERERRERRKYLPPQSNAAKSENRWQGLPFLEQILQTGTTSACKAKQRTQWQAEAKIQGGFKWILFKRSSSPTHPNILRLRFSFRFVSTGYLQQSRESLLSFSMFSHLFSYYSISFNPCIHISCLWWDQEHLASQ